MWMSSFYKEQKIKEEEEKKQKELGMKKKEEKDRKSESQNNNNKIEQSKQMEINKLKEQLFSEEINNKENIKNIKSEVNETNKNEAQNIKKEKSEIELENEKNKEYLKQLFDEPEDENKMKIDENNDDMHIDIETKSEYSESNVSRRNSESSSKRKDSNSKLLKKIRRSSTRSDTSKGGKVENTSNSDIKIERESDKNKTEDGLAKRKRESETNIENPQDNGVQKRIKTEEKTSEVSSPIKNDIKNTEDSATSQSEKSDKNNNKSTASQSNDDVEMSDRQNSSSNNTHSANVRKVSLRDYKLKRGSSINSITPNVNKANSTFSLFSNPISQTSTRVKSLDSSLLFSDTMPSLSSTLNKTSQQEAIPNVKQKDDLFSKINNVELKNPSPLSQKVTDTTTSSILSTIDISAKPEKTTTEPTKKDRCILYIAIIIPTSDINAKCIVY